MSTTTTTSMLDAALEYATERGWRVIPIPPGQKYPRHKAWQNIATTDTAMIEVWWERDPDHGIGIACGEVSDLVVIDVDINDGKVGARTLADLEESHGPLPETYTVQTPTGGWHHYFRWDPARPTSNGKLGLHVDIRGQGGQVLAPPSIHPDTGTAYRVHLDVPLADLPDWVYLEAQSGKTLPADLQEASDVPGKATVKGADLHPLSPEVVVSPWADYNARTTWSDILTTDGWTLHHVKRDDNGIETVHWTRPEKDPKKGSSGTTGRGRDTLKVFTEFIPELDTEGTYTRFGYYAAMNHDGDIDAAADKLRSLGYGNDRVMNHRPDTAATGPEVVVVRPDAEGADGFHLTDTGNAGRLAHHHGGHLRFIPRWKQWLAWDGKRWQIDYGATMATRYAGSIAGTIWELVPGLTADDRKRHVRHAEKSESRRTIGDSLKLAEAPLAASHDDLDQHHYLLNVNNGIIDLTTGELRPHDPKLLLTKLAPATYDAQATAPTWHRFLERILPDLEVRNFVQRAVGYSITGDVSEQVLIIVHGDGANGKSTFIEMISQLLGDYATIASDELLLARKDSVHPTGKTDLHGARFAAAVETEAGARLAEAQVKLLTGGDRIKARRMNQDYWEFDPTHTLWLGANHRPRIPGDDYAIWRRIRLVPFTETIPVAEQDRHLRGKLTAELPGILAWAVAGCLDWQANGLTAPAAIEAAVEQYRRDEDWMLRFIEDRDLEFGEGGMANNVLMEHYRSWCSANDETPVGTKTFAAKLKSRGCTPFRNAHGRGWSGIRAQ